MTAQWLKDINYAQITAVSPAVSEQPGEITAYNAHGQKIPQGMARAGFRIITYKNGDNTYSKKQIAE